MVVEELQALALFEGVSEEQLRTLVDASEVITYAPGDIMWRWGHASEFWFVNIEGVVDMVQTSGGEETIVLRLSEPGRWAGGFGAWDDHAVYLGTGRAASPGRLLKVPKAALKALIDDLPLVAHLAAGLFRTARTVEENARQRDALVTLGTLSAGLAHELNNPAAAAARAVVGLGESCDTMLSSLGGLATANVTSAQYIELDGLRRALQPSVASEAPLAVADREEELSRWMAEHNIDRDWRLAPALAAAGADVAWCEQVYVLLGDSSVQPALEWVESTLTAAALLSEVQESTRRVSELVASVKSYSQMDRAQLQRFDLTDGIDSTLTMLGHKLRDEITVVRDYGTVPPIDAYAGELNQVWTNLIDNAIDAMGGSGTLKIRTAVQDSSVLVEFEDSGVGMSPEVAARAFEAFFTTKDVGRGTGLGLDIARRIVVERHGGAIALESEPGRTVVRVTLPLLAQPR